VRRGKLSNELGIESRSDIWRFRRSCGRHPEAGGDGQFKPVVLPLWCRCVWLNEMVNGIYESIMAPVVAFFHGTPAAAFLLALIGCKIRSRCYIGSTCSPNSIWSTSAITWRSMPVWWCRIIFSRIASSDTWCSMPKRRVSAKREFPMRCFQALQILLWGQDRQLFERFRWPAAPPIIEAIAATAKRAV
jgi:hypothetical protein